MNDNYMIEVAKRAVEESFKTAREFIEKLANPALAELGGMLGDNAKYWRLKNMVNLALKAKLLLEDKGIELKKVSLKILFPWLENGSIAESNDLQDKWSAILANAADPSYSGAILPIYPEILKDLTPTEILILEGVYDKLNKIECPKKFEYLFSNQAFCKNNVVAEDRFDLLLDNLFRLRICQPPATYGGVAVGSSDGDQNPISVSTYKFFSVTPFEHAFISSCRCSK